MLQEVRFKIRNGTVQAGVLRSFESLVREYGGRPAELLRSVGLSQEYLRQCLAEGRIAYDQFVALLNVTAASLGLPDFGMKLAERHARSGFVGPLHIAMRNSATLGAAFQYCSDNVHAYSECTAFTLIDNAASHRWILRVDIWSSRQMDRRQVIEHALLTNHLLVLSLSGGKVRPLEIWFTHDPISELSTYARYFSVSLRFSQPLNAVVLDTVHKTFPIAGRDDEVYRLATSFIARNLGRPEEGVHERVRRVLLQRSDIRSISAAEVARSLGMHPRTLQRRLREEGLNFNGVRDQICREMAWHYLCHTRLPVARVAGMLGYREVSAFSYRCRKWFASPPGEFRRSLQRGAATADSPR